MAVVIVQGGSANGATALASTTVAKALGSSVTAGNQLFAMFIVDSNVNLNSITDSQGNTWSVDGQATSDQCAEYIKWGHCENAAAGTTTVTGNFASSCDKAMQLYEISGLKTTSYDSAAYAGAYDTLVNNVFTPTTQPAIAFAIYTSGGGSTTRGATDGWTADYAPGSLANYGYFHSLVISSTGSRNAEITRATATPMASHAAWYLGASAAAFVAAPPFIKSQAIKRASYY